MEAGGRDARIAILPTASAVPLERAGFYSQVFSDIGAGESFAVPIVAREDAEADPQVEAIHRSTGLFLTGGDQARLVSALTGTRSFGIDAAIVYWGNGELEVIGSGHVFIVDASHATARGLEQAAGDRPPSRCRT